LIINIPKDFKFLGIDSNVGFSIPAGYPVTFPDNSVQIKADLIGQLDNEERYVQFTAKAPTITNTTMYVMHILGTGASDKAFPKLSIGPLAETVIQVCGSVSGCP